MKYKKLHVNTGVKLINLIVIYRFRTSLVLHQDTLHDKSWSKVYKLCKTESHMTSLSLKKTCFIVSKKKAQDIYKVLRVIQGNS